MAERAGGMPASEMPAGEAELRDALRRLRADAVQRLGERVQELARAWEQDVRPSLLAGQASMGAPGETLLEALGELAGAAHRLSGSGGTFGFPAISAAAAPLELILLGLRDDPAPRPGHLLQAEQLIAALRAAWEAGPQGEMTEAAEGGAHHPVETAEPIFLFATPRNQALLSAVITSLGYSIERVGGEPSALQRPPGRRHCAAVVDDELEAPLEVCQTLAGHCPVVLLTGDIGFPARLAAARAGVDAVVAKPLEVNELADWLDHFAGHRSDPGFSILIVDDDRLLAETYALALRRAGMQVATVADPSQVIEAIAATGPDLILMDMQMPETDGIELARVIRQTRRHLSLPILFLSAEQDQQRQMLARRLGGDDFIPKPVDLDRLVSQVRMRAERARALRAVMETDSLTGLLNHARFKERVALELARAERHGSPLSLAILDLDHFKSVNDRFGHLVGDRVIRALSRALQKRLRRTDVIGRYGGEEFAVLLPNTRPEAALAAIDGIRARFAEAPFEAAGGCFTASFSAGIAGADGGAQPEAMISAADAALYAAKRAGRNRVMLAGD